MPSAESKKTIRKNLFAGTEQLQILLNKLHKQDGARLEPDDDISTMLRDALYEHIYIGLEALYPDYELVRDVGGTRPIWKDLDA